MLDSWVVQEVSIEAKLDYGNIRLWGSIGFALTSLLYSKIIQANLMERKLWRWCIAMEDTIPDNRTVNLNL